MQTAPGPLFEVHNSGQTEPRRYYKHCPRIRRFCLKEILKKICEAGKLTIFRRPHNSMIGNICWNSRAESRARSIRRFPNSLVIVTDLQYSDNRAQQSSIRTTKYANSAVRRASGSIEPFSVFVGSLMTYLLTDFCVVSAQA